MLGAQKRRNLDMRAIIILACLFLTYTSLSAQDIQNHSSYELYGSILYNYSSIKSRNLWIGKDNSDKTYLFTFQPTAGYFLTEHIELLTDLIYVYSYQSDYYYGPGPVFENPNIIRRHSIGFNFGATYNIQFNPFISAFMGSKVGLSWWKGSETSSDNFGWSKDQISFPMFLVGGRFFVTRYWSVLLLVQYSKIDFSDPTYYSSISSEGVSLGFGFSVFL